MKVLFVCRANSGRSQIAMELYNQLHPGEAESAGTIVEEPGQELINRPTARIGISIMKEVGIDMTHNKRRQLTAEMLNEYDLIIVLAEPEVIPDYLYSANNVLLRPVEDIRYKNRVDGWKICKDIWKIVLDVSERLHPAPVTPSVNL